MIQKLVLLGASTAYWEIKQLIDDINAVEERYEIVGVCDDNKDLEGLVYDGITVQTPLEKSLEHENVKYILAIGSYHTRLLRQDVLTRLNIPEKLFETLIHPKAKIFASSSVGHGCIIHINTVVFNHSVIEDFVIVAANCVIAVGNYIGRCALLGSSIVTTTGVKIGDSCFVGSGTAIGENVEIEPGAQIGLGSLILKNINAGVFVLGNPPRMIDKTDVAESMIAKWKDKINQKSE